MIPSPCTLPHTTFHPPIFIVHCSPSLIATPKSQHQASPVLCTSHPPLQALIPSTGQAQLKRELILSVANKGWEPPPHPFKDPLENVSLLPVPLQMHIHQHKGQISYPGLGVSSWSQEPSSGIVSSHWGSLHPAPGFHERAGASIQSAPSCKTHSKDTGN